MRHVVLPRAFKRVLPPLAGQFIPGQGQLAGVGDRDYHVAEKRSRGGHYVVLAA